MVIPITVTNPLRQGRTQTRKSCIRNIRNGVGKIKYLPQKHEDVCSDLQIPNTPEKARGSSAHLYFWH